eukprot:COSAG05_NODE_682_length_7957_cov_277.290405_6_plen_51_part_00
MLALLATDMDCYTAWPICGLQLAVYDMPLPLPGVIPIASRQNSRRGWTTR